jgi:hypothetical protein
MVASIYSTKLRTDWAKTYRYLYVSKQLVIINLTPLARFNNVTPALRFFFLQVQLPVNLNILVVLLNSRHIKGASSDVIESYGSNIYLLLIAVCRSTINLPVSSLYCNCNGIKFLDLNKMVQFNFSYLRISTSIFVSLNHWHCSIWSTSTRNKSSWI